MLVLKSFRTSAVLINGIELAAKIKKERYKTGKLGGRTATMLGRTGCIAILTLESNWASPTEVSHNSEFAPEPSMAFNQHQALQRSFGKLSHANAQFLRCKGS